MSKKALATPVDKQPKYPIYILSKGRWDTLLTMKSLNIFDIPYYVTVEKHEYDQYVKALKDFPNATVLELPWSNHGKGSGPARNWCWDHSMSLGFERHWVMDDNIRSFRRLHKNKRYRIKTGSFFRLMEDFSDRYTNVMLSGPQYKFFAVEKESFPPVLPNTRLMSCILVNNSCKHRWRGKWNEDVDLSLRVLKDGDCTLLFYQFLQEKMRTGTVKGGNTEEIYGDGTFKKSKMLVDLHPDVVELKHRYGRWHHHVNIKPFAHNELKFRPDFKMPTEDNEYGLVLVKNWGKPNREIIEL